MKRPPKRYYTEEFKAEAVRLASTSDKSAAQVARDLGIPPNTLYQWIDLARVDPAEAKTAPPSSNDREELARLRRLYEQACQERDFLKKAVAFFAKEQK